MKIKQIITVILLQSVFCWHTNVLAADMPSVEKISGNKFTMEVFTSTVHGYSVTSSIIYGEKDALLIDPQLLLPEAKRVVALIKASGRTLKTIYSTHAHPDHFLGVAAILEAFPDAHYVALPEVRERMVTAWPGRRNFWYPTYGDELPSEVAILPEPLMDPPMLTLEGQQLPITRDQIGLDGPGNSFVYIADLKAVVAGDIIFNSHLRPPVDTAPLYATLERIAALNPLWVVAGHQAEGARSDAKVLDFVREYIGAFKMARMLSKTPEELQQKMKALYPELGRVDALEQASETAFK